MFGSISRLQRAIVCAVFALGALALYGALDLAAAQEKQQKPQKPVAKQKPVVINVKELGPERFRELFPTWPDNAVLEADGKRITVGELKAKMEQQRAAAQAKMDEAERKAAAELERRRAAFRESEKARLEAARKEAMAYFERLPKPPSAEVQAELQAIREELWNLRQRARTASPKEQEEILRRANELVRKYSRLTAPTKPPD